MACLTLSLSHQPNNRAVDFLLSGNRVTPDFLLQEPLRFAALDGRITANLDDAFGPEIMPWLSESWSTVFGREGAPFSEEVKQEMATITSKAHDRGQLVRFWATPDSTDFWDELIHNNVDLINVDDYDLLASYLRN